jgi:hypothetical protein
MWEFKPCGLIAPMWCNVVQFVIMPANFMTSSNKMSEEIKSSATVRTSVSIPCGLHNELEKLARDKRVSLAWVIRDAAEKYVADQGRPLSDPKSA